MRRMRAVDEEQVPRHRRDSQQEDPQVAHLRMAVLQEDIMTQMAVHQNLEDFQASWRTTSGRRTRI